MVRHQIYLCCKLILLFVGDHQKGLIESFKELRRLLTCE